MKWDKEEVYAPTIQPGYISVATNDIGTYAVLSAVGDDNLEYVGIFSGDGQLKSGTLGHQNLYCPDRAAIRPGAAGDAFYVSYIAEINAAPCGSNSTAATGLMPTTVSSSTGNMAAAIPDQSRLQTVSTFQDLDLATDADGNPFLLANGSTAVGGPLQAVEEPGVGDTPVSNDLTNGSIVAMDVAKVGTPPAVVAAYTVQGAAKYHVRTSPGSWMDVTPGTPRVIDGPRMGVAVWDDQNYAVAYWQDNGMDWAIIVDAHKDGATFSGLTLYGETGAQIGLLHLKLIAAGLTEDGNDVIYYAFWVQEGGNYNIYFSISTDSGETWGTPEPVNTDEMIFVTDLDATYNPDDRQIHTWWIGESVSGGMGVFYSVGGD